MNAMGRPTAFDVSLRVGGDRLVRTEPRAAIDVFALRLRAERDEIEAEDLAQKYRGRFQLETLAARQCLEDAVAYDPDSGDEDGTVAYESWQFELPILALEVLR